MLNNMLGNVISNSGPSVGNVPWMHTLLSFAAHQKQEMLLVASFSHHGFWNAVFMGNFTIVRHGLMLLWFKDLMNSTEKFQFIDPTFRHSWLVPSSGDFLGNSVLLAPLFPKPTNKTEALLSYSVFVVRTVFQLLYCCCGGERKPT